MEGVKTKVCIKCREEKGISYFFNNRATKMGRSIFCRKCTLKSMRDKRVRDRLNNRKNKLVCRPSDRPHPRCIQLNEFAVKIISSPVPKEDIVETFSIFTQAINNLVINSKGNDL